MKEMLKYAASIGDDGAINRIFWESFAYYVALYILWTELNVTLLRFVDIEDGLVGLADDFLIVLYLIGLLILSFQIPSNSAQTHQYLFKNESKTPIICGMLICFGSWLILHCLYYIQLRAAKHYTRRRIKTYCISLVLLLCALISEVGFADIVFLGDLGLVLTIIACVIILYVTLVSFRVHPYARDITDPNSKFFQSVATDLFTLRFGILIMVVTGESILAILINPRIHSARAYACVFVSFVIVYIVQQMYFDTYAKHSQHALHCIFKPGSVAWVFVHLPLSYFMVCIGMFECVLHIVFFVQTCAKLMQLGAICWCVCNK